MTPAVPVRSFRFRPAKLFSRGVTLVELAIVLVIIGLVVGAIYGRVRLDSDTGQVETAKKELAAIHDSILLYAAKNQTAQRRVSVRRIDSGNTSDDRLISFNDVLPGGRPVLPCPDINGDGLEDRQKGGAIPDGDITIIFTEPDADHDLADNPLLDFGNCILQKGALPWRSLPGISRERDVWGNLYTYRVDVNFANRMIGFDEHTRADSFDLRRQATVSADGIVRLTRRPDIAEAEWQTLANEVTVLATTAVKLTTNRRPSIVCRRPMCGAEGTLSVDELAAGRFAGATLNLTVSRRFITGGPIGRVVRGFDPQDTLEGLPFVVVSHGRIHGGARLPPHKAPDGAAERGVFCAPYDPARASDVNNALDFSLRPVGGASQVQSAGRQGANRFQCDGAPDTLTDPNILAGARNMSELADEFRDHGFVQPEADIVQHNLTGEDAAPNHDDIVTWMTAADITRAAYRAGILPVSPLPVLGVPHEKP